MPAIAAVAGRRSFPAKSQIVKALTACTARSAGRGPPRAPACPGSCPADHDADLPETPRKEEVIRRLLAHHASRPGRRHGGQLLRRHPATGPRRYRSCSGRRARDHGHRRDAGGGPAVPRTGGTGRASARAHLDDSVAGHVAGSGGDPGAAGGAAVRAGPGERPERAQPGVAATAGLARRSARRYVAGTLAGQRRRGGRRFLAAGHHLLAARARPCCGSCAPPGSGRPPS